MAEQMSPYDMLIRSMQESSDASTQMAKNIAMMQQRSSEYNDKFLDITDRQLKREEALGSGNPFIDMLDGYIRMKQQKNPQYQWGGLAVPAAKGIGWLGKQAGNGISGLIGMLKGIGE